MWLVFTTGATAGFGDLVLSTPASRIFAVCTVLLGYALFSVVMASIAALVVGKDEKRLKRGLTMDFRTLRAGPHRKQGNATREEADDAASQ